MSLKQTKKELEQTVIKRTAEVVAQQNRSEELLLNILPAEVALELKETGHTKPVYFEEVSILFADFKDFTSIVASIPGKKLVEELDNIFQYFDDIIDDVGLEKIKTIGDAYVAAGGLPRQDPDHAIKCVEAAKRMIDYLIERNKTGSIKWKLRAGIHSGPITAGVVGKRKFTYDVFGDTVNIAARIESASEEGRINISAYTHDLIKDHLACEYRGKINAKGKGDLDMYFVN
jgi:class 3 adenylate cyclase